MSSSITNKNDTESHCDLSPPSYERVDIANLKHAPSPVDYGLHHGATLKVDIEDGRFMFFYLPVDL